MIPSLRLAVYCGLGAVLWVVTAAMREFVAMAALYDLVLIFVATMDVLLSPRPREFEIERSVEGKMNLGVPNSVTLRVRSRARLPVRLILRDEPPPTWLVAVPGAASGVPMAAPAAGAMGSPPVDEAVGAPVAVPPVARVAVEVAPLSEAGAAYTVTPARRGDYRFGTLSARYGTYFGLWYRQFRRVAPESVRVYPDVTEVRRYELRLRQGRLREIGLHLTRLRGRGTEFESLRDYTRDDEYKSINWKASARQGKLISTNYEIERDQTILIALDCGRMMTAMAVTRAARHRNPEPPARSATMSLTAAAGPMPAAPRAEPAERPPAPDIALSKLDCAINATVLLAHVAASMGDAVGLLLFADSVARFVPPRKGRGQTGAIIEALYGAQPALVEPDYGAAYEFLIARRVRRALVVTFTDLIDPVASRELLTASGALRHHHNALCITINNRDVIDLAAVMPQDAAELYQKAMAQRMLAQRAHALAELRRRGVGILDASAEQLTVATVNRYLEIKSRTAL